MNDKEIYEMLKGADLTEAELNAKLKRLEELESENERLRLERDVLIGKKIVENQKYDNALVMKIDIQEQLKARIAELEDQRDRQAYIAEELIQEKHRWTEQARKETAKEIYRKLTELSENPCNSREEIYKEVFGQYGVEVEE